MESNKDTQLEEWIKDWAEGLEAFLYPMEDEHLFTDDCKKALMQKLEELIANVVTMYDHHFVNDVEPAKDFAEFFERPSGKHPTDYGWQPTFYRAEVATLCEDLHNEMYYMMYGEDIPERAMELYDSSISDLVRHIGYIDLVDLPLVAHQESNAV